MDIFDIVMAKKLSGGGGGSVPEYEGSYTVTPSESAQTLATKDKKATDNITVNPIPSQYVVPTGTKSISANGTGIDVASFASVDVNVSGGGGAQNLYGEFFFKKTITDSGFPFIVPQPDPGDQDAMDAYMEQDFRPYVAWVGIAFADPNAGPSATYYGLFFAETDLGQGYLSLCIATRPENDGPITIMDGGFQAIAADMQNDGIYEFEESSGNLRWTLLDDTNGERNKSYYADLLAWVNANAFKTGDY